MAFVSNLAVAWQKVLLQHAERTALLYPETGERITYAKLDALAEGIARNLWDRGLRPGQVVAMFHDKSPAAFASMLACLRLGVIYTNLDPDSPWERLRRILSTCQPSLIINAYGTLPCEAELSGAGFTSVLSLRDLSGPSAAVIPAYGMVIHGGSPAYIMFTSGSTGTPKGAVMSHANLLWFIGWAQNRFGITAEDVLTNVNPIYFDNSVFDFYSAVFSGATLVPVSAAQVRDPRGLVRLVGDAGCTLWFSVPSLLIYLLTTRALSATSFPKVRKIIFGGEGFPKTKLKQLHDMLGARATLENVYGPTECTCICSAYSIRQGDFEDMRALAPLGQLAENFDYEILPLDERDPDFGELFLRGPQVGLGYYNDPERTARSFVQNPRHSRYADVGYRSGDLVRRDARGVLHFKGRTDFQIKHMGYRIELEEIEAALGTFPEIRECAVVYQQLGDGLGQILACVATDDAGLSPESLRKRLMTIVPAYMVPRQVRILDVLPKNANGKIDRNSVLRLMQEAAAT